MLHPTQEEIEQAARLDIDYEGMNGPQIRDAIRRALASRRPRKHQSEAELDNMRPYLELRAIAAELGIDVPARITLEDLKTRTEVGIAAIFTQRGWQKNTVIQFSSDAPWHAGKKRELCVHLSDGYKASPISLFTWKAKPGHMFIVHITLSCMQLR